MGDDEEVLSSDSLEPSLQDVNEQTIDNDKSVTAELKKVDFFPSSDISLGSTLESKPNEPASVEGNLDTGDVKEMAIDAGIDVTEKMDKDFPVEGGDELLSNSLDSGDELVEQATILEVVKEEMPGEGVAQKSEDEIGDETVVEEETPSLDTDLEMSTGVGGSMTTSVVSRDHPSASDLATSNQDAATHFDKMDLLDTGGGENKSSDVQVTSSESALVVADVDKPEVAVVDKPEYNEEVAEVHTSDEVDRPEVTEEVAEVHTSVFTVDAVAESEDLQIMDVESLEEDRHQKALVDPVEHAVGSAAGDLKIPVAASDATEISGAVLPVGLKDAAADVTVEKGTEVDADTAVEVVEVIKEEQDAEIEDFPVLGSESRVTTEVGQDGRFAEGENVIRDSVKVEVMESDPSKDPEMRGLELGGYETVVALGTEEDKDKLKAGVTLEDPQAIKESKMEIDGSEDEESVGKLHSLEIDADDQEDEENVTGEDEENVTGEETGLADTDLVTETDAGESVKATDTDMETEPYAVDSGKSVGGRRKKGKISKVPGNSKLASRAQKTTGEDVCFICFDGGDLYICDRRGCGKAYHPSCVDRDEAFFRAKGRWNCGWHLCIKCRKNAHYMCYTCTFSLCKACIKDAVILCVRGNKGFCETCMKTVLLIENHDNSHGDAKIDFDDKSSWEFLFKDYYTDLKSKHDLSFAEISEAKNPWKGSEALTVKEDSPEAAVGAKSNEGSDSDNHAESQEASKSKRRKDKKRLKTLAKGRVSSSSAASVLDDGEGISGPGSTEWASKELLELVMHMKDGDRSPLSPFDVQALLLEYIKRNKLRDPRGKSQIICDARLGLLFRKERVGHFEMLKLLESHFLLKDDSQVDDVQGSVVDTEANHSEANENAETPTKGIKDKKRKLHKKGIGRGPQYSRYEFAAIDMHNISLIYLRRKLMEDLLVDTDEFSNKVVGTFVRIRISGSVQKQDLYRLVLVVGTSKAAEPYKMGKRTTDTMLEILNLNKTEIVSIDSISNQEFTEEECNRLRQSIKCGLLNRMTVGDILDKAMELQEARVNDWLETEIMRLSHLRDRASDMGRKKQLRECVEKLQILKTPEERMRRLEEVPQVHADPNMDPNHESEEDDSEHEDSRQVFMKTKSSGFTRRGGGNDFSPRDSWSGSKFTNKNRDVDHPFSNRNLARGEDVFQGIDKDTSRNQRRDREVQDDHLLKLSSPSQPDNVGWSSQPVARSDKLAVVGSSVDSPLSVSAKQQQQGISSAIVPMTPSTPANEASAVKVNETQKTWHYKDPSGKVQGPFSMVQLRKWSNTGYFPADLRIWKAGDNPDDSFLLTDALAGRFPELLPSGARSLQSSHVLSDLSQNHGALILHNDSSAVKHSAEKWIGNDLSHLPSPTPNRGNNAGRKGEEEIAVGATSYLSIVQSPAATLVGHPNLSLGQTSTHNSAEQVTRGPEADFRNSRAGFAQTPTGEQNIMVSVNALQDSSSGKGDAIETHITTLPIQQVINGQNSHGGTHSWGEPASSQKTETNLPVPVTHQSYDQQGAITNPNAGNFSNPGLVLAQQENWRPTPMQVDQSNNNNMQQPVAANNLAWGNMVVDPNSAGATALRPGNPNIGWGPPMQQQQQQQGGGAMNGGWVGPLPPPPPPNMNWGAVVQGPGGNANPGWVMAGANMNLATTVQGQNMMGNMNPGWFGPIPAGNMMGGGVQGLVPAVVTSGWVPPVANMVSAVQPQPAPGNGWAMPTGAHPSTTQGSAAAAAAAAPGNSNQGGWGGGDQYSGGGGDSRGGGYGRGGRGGYQGSGGGGDTRWKRDFMCPFNNNGRCRKGATCDFRHG